MTRRQSGSTACSPPSETRPGATFCAALGEHSVSALARQYSTSLAAVQKHVAVLERATLVTKRRRGREQLVRTDVATVQEARRQLESLESLWRGRLDRFGEALADRPEEQDP